MPRTAAAKPIPEKQLQGEVEHLARMLGWLVVHHRWSIGTERGWPDIVALRPPRCIVAELKSEKGELSPEQNLWLRTWEQIPGVEVWLWRPSDLEKIKGILR
jgi:hypothetical protein